MTTLLPAVGYLLMLIPMHFYNITGDDHRRMMKDIMARRAKAGDALAQEEVAEEEAQEKKEQESATAQ